MFFVFLLVRIQRLIFRKIISGESNIFHVYLLVLICYLGLENAHFLPFWALYFLETLVLGVIFCTMKIYDLSVAVFHTSCLLVIFFSF